MPKQLRAQMNMTLIRLRCLLRTITPPNITVSIHYGISVEFRMDTFQNLQHEFLALYNGIFDPDTFMIWRLIVPPSIETLGSLSMSADIRIFYFFRKLSICRPRSSVRVPPSLPILVNRGRGGGGSEVQAKFVTGGGCGGMSRLGRKMMSRPATRHIACRSEAIRSPA